MELCDSEFGRFNGDYDNLITLVININLYQRLICTYCAGIIKIDTYLNYLLFYV